MAEATKKSRNELVLKKKVEVIEYANKNPAAGSRKIASVFASNSVYSST